MLRPLSPIFQPGNMVAGGSLLLSRQICGFISMDPFRIGVCSWSMRPGSPHDLIHACESVGLADVQLAMNPVVREPDRWGTAVEELRREGIDILSGMMATIGEDYSTLESIAQTGGVRPDQHWKQNLALAHEIAAGAADSAISLVTLHAGFLPERPHDPERVKLIRRLWRLADVFADHGVRLAFETGQETAATLCEVLAELNHANAGVNFDPANMILYGKGDPVEALRMLAPYVRQIHIKDAIASDQPGVTWGREVPVGHGEVDWPTFFQVARTIDPPVAFVIEREAGADRLDDIITARKLIQRRLEATA